jgi:peptidoglycan/xylan/chitin deacetylase (PgdA/CDA1 family)
MNILMYHSVSEGPAPLCITPEVFRRQMECLSRLGMRAITLAQWIESDCAEEDSVVLTFDDGYKDMLTAVAPELEQRGWSATVFLACRLTDKQKAPFAPWAELLSWSDAEELVQAGWEVGSHTLTHPDLTTLTPDELETEVGDSRKEIEQRLGCPVRSFAAPCGYTSPRVTESIGRHYDTAVGTVLGVAGRKSDRLDLPRLEVHYFQSIRRFERQMRGDGGAYLALRRTLRKMKQTLERKS